MPHCHIGLGPPLFQPRSRRHLGLPSVNSSILARSLTWDAGLGYVTFLFFFSQVGLSLDGKLSSLQFRRYRACFDDCHFFRANFPRFTIWRVEKSVERVGRLFGSFEYRNDLIQAWLTNIETDHQFLGNG